MPQSPPGREPLGVKTFRFSCDPAVPCYNRCCHNPDLELYPYDIVRLAARLKLTSSEFLSRHTRNAIRTNPMFPSVMLRMADAPDRPCPFLSNSGCSVYEARPDACRMFPLERGVSLQPFKPDTLKEEYYLQKVPFCQGHDRGDEWTSSAWVSSQGLAEYNRMGNIWTELSLLFRRNPWGPDGQESRVFRMAFTACYDMDRFREFVFKSTFLSRHRPTDEWMTRIEASNEALLEFGMDWLRHFLFNAAPRYFSTVSPTR